MSSFTDHTPLEDEGTGGSLSLASTSRAPAILSNLLPHGTSQWNRSGDYVDRLKNAYNMTFKTVQPDGKQISFMDCINEIADLKHLDLDSSRDYSALMAAVDNNLDLDFAISDYDDATGEFDGGMTKKNTSHTIDKMMSRIIRDGNIEFNLRTHMLEFLSTLKICLMLQPERRQESHFMELFCRFAALANLNFGIGYRETAHLPPVDGIHSSLPDLVLLDVPSQRGHDWTNFYYKPTLLAVAGVKKPLPTNFSGTSPLSGHSAKLMAGMSSPRNSHPCPLRAGCEDERLAHELVGELLGEMLVNWNRSAFLFCNRMLAFGVQGTKVQLFVLFMLKSKRPVCDEDSDKPENSVPSSRREAGIAADCEHGISVDRSQLLQSWSYDFLKKDDRRDLLMAFAHLSSFKFSKCYNL